MAGVSATPISSRPVADCLDVNRKTGPAKAGSNSSIGFRALPPLSDEHLFGPEQCRDGLRVRDLPLAHPGERRGERQREHLEELLVVELRALVLEPLREVEEEFLEVF